MLGISDVVLFGIKSGLKLAHQKRQAFIEETISRKLVVPLLEFDTSFTLGSANQFFRSPAGQIKLDLHPKLHELFEKADNFESLGENEDAYINAAFEFRLLENIKLADGENNNGELTTEKIHITGLDPSALKSIVTIQQFSRLHKPESASSFQRVIGSLVEIGLDAYSKFPGLIDTESAAGRAISGFLHAIDGLDFKSEDVESLARSLFISAVETINQNTDLLSADEKTEWLIKSVSSGLIQDLINRLEKDGDNLIVREEIERWGQLVFRSVLSNVGETVLSNPKSIGIDDPAQQALISSVGTSILSAILDERKVNLKALFSKQSLDQVVKSSLITVSEFPDLLGVDGKGLEKIISQVADGLASNDFALGRDILPETVRLVIEKTAQNAEFLIPSVFSDPGKHLLAKAAVKFLDQFADMPESVQTWRPSLTKSQLTELLEVVLEETLQNPNWVSKLGISQDSVLGEATHVALKILQEIPANQINLETGTNILRGVIQAVSKRLDFMDILGIPEEKKSALEIALKEIIGSILSKDLDPKVVWTMARGEVASTIINTALETLAEIGINLETIKMVVGVIERAKQSIIKGGRWVLNEVLDELKDLAVVPTT